MEFSGAVLLIGSSNVRLTCVAVELRPNSPWCKWLICGRSYLGL